MVIIQAFKENIFLGCSLHFIGDNTLYGRYWGALQEVPFLHFELCYYQAIEFAIQNKLKRLKLVLRENIKFQEVIFLNLHTVTTGLNLKN